MHVKLLCIFSLKVHYCITLFVSFMDYSGEFSGKCSDTRSMRNVHFTVPLYASLL